MDKAVTRKRNKMRGEQRGRNVNPLALQQVHDLLGDMPIRRDLLIEYLHLIQDKYKKNLINNQIILILSQQIIIS